MSPRVTVIIRARDEEASIARCLELVRSQEDRDCSPELIVVDSGSSDRTVEIASGHGARVLELPPDSFTFGGALNLGAANARGELLVALSADAHAPDPGWLRRMCEPFADETVACACGSTHGPDDRPLTERVVQDQQLADRWPEWGYSNGAGAFRAALWRARPFRADLAGCEDKEWAWHWLHRGYVCVIDPAFAVDHDHIHDSLPQTYRRARREALGYAGFLDLEPYGPHELTREWWRQRGWHRSRLRSLASPRRVVRLLGNYAGRRAATMSGR